MNCDIRLLILERSYRMDVQKILGDDASYLLEHTAEAIPAKLLTTPGPDFVTEIFSETD